MNIQTREMLIDTRTATADRTVAVSISSDIPLDRYDYVEILSHDAKAIDLSRAPLPLVEGHDTSKVNVGIIEGLRTDGKKLRGILRMGASQRATELWADIQSGVVRGLSVGYEILSHTTNGKTVTATRWKPYETSLVAVPADNSVGIGRSHTFNLEHQNMNTTENYDPAQAGRAQKSANELQLRELQRRDDLRVLGDQFKEFGGVELARSMIESGGDADTLKSRVLEKMQTVRALPLAEPNADYLPGGRNYRASEQVAWGQGPQEILPKPKYFTGPNAELRAYESGMWLRALHGNDQAGRWCRERGIELRAMSPAAISQGGALVPDALSSQIIDLANVYGTFRQHSDVYQLGSDSLGVPRSVSDPVATFTAANGLIAESQGDWDLVQLVSKKAASLVRIPTELMEDSVINIADRVTFQLSRSFSKLEDSCGYIGNGSSTYGGINGLLNIVMDGAHNLAKVSATTGHDLFSEIDAVDLSNMVARLPEFALEGAAWYCSATAFGSVFSRIMQTAGGNSTLTLGGKIPTMYGGFPVVLSSVLPSATSSYLNLPMLLFGNMRQSSKFGSRRDIRIQMLTETFAQNDQIGIQATERFDIVNSDLGSNTVQGPMVALIGA